MNTTNFLYDYFEEDMIFYYQEIKLPVVGKSEIKLDITLNEKNVKKIWGFVTERRGKPVPQARVSLFQYGYIRGCLNYMPVKDTLTNEAGFYQFTLERHKSRKELKIAVDMVE